ncbi:galactofuranose ABC transporter, permease protein YjfF [Blastococcus haudaquaticus]|uniref:Simple sugar transport system permease protein n=1 Tax=Blastococcus haudaquaticus TaxID=1938745 RepID=A0A286GYF0_9ACTN|nr:galactofuranose ABC transporter, permease protein YjfF [Blastococcus haudaquaticus]SOE00119.1 simple sugar transport system permease protein [Blastococcus haudaquaticus]
MTVSDTRPASEGAGSTAPAPPPAWQTWLRASTTGSRTFSVLVTAVLLVVLFGAGSVRYENFGTPQVVLNLFVDNAHLIVLAVGMTFVILTGGIDLSAGAVVALSTVMAARMLEAGWSAPLTVLAVLATGALLGWAMGAAVHHLQLQPFIVTLAGMFLARGLCFVISVPSIPIRDPAFTSLATNFVELPGGTFLTYSVFIALTVLIAAMWVLHRTRFGRTVYAVGGNENSAALMGLAVSRTKVGVYVISGTCSALAGLLFSLYMLSGYSLHGIGMELDAIAAVVIGGTLLTGGAGYVFGSLLGVLVLGTIQALISFDGGLSSWWTRITIGVLLLAFVVVQRLSTRSAGSSG